MNDFADIESELKTLRPAQPSGALFARVGQALADSQNVKIIRPARFRLNWAAAGFGLATAAVFLLLARVSTDRTRARSETVVQGSPATETRHVLPARRGGSEAEGPRSVDQFIPAGTTEVVYDALDDGLRFVDGSEVPMRRLRYQTHETLQWLNPHTGESLRVSYPSEEIVLLPISGQ
jgi:hypothetical protein